jgi:hypothetical protein
VQQKEGEEGIVGQFVKVRGMMRWMWGDSYRDNNHDATEVVR